VKSIDTTAPGQVSCSDRSPGQRQRPFAKIHKEDASDPRLTPTAFRLLTWLLAQAMGGPFAYASVRQLSEELHCSERSIQYAIKLLEKLEYYVIVPSTHLTVGRVFQFEIVTSQAAADAVQRLGLDPSKIETVKPIKPSIPLSPPLRSRPARPDAPGAEICTPPRNHLHPDRSLRKEREKEDQRRPETEVQLPLKRNERPEKEHPIPRLTQEQARAQIEDSARVQAVVNEIDAIGPQATPEQINHAAGMMATMLRDGKSAGSFASKLRMVADRLAPGTAVSGAFRDAMERVAAGVVLNPGAYFETCFKERCKAWANVQAEQRQYAEQRKRDREQRERAKAPGPVRSENPVPALEPVAMPPVSLEPPHSTEAALEPEKPPVDRYRPSHGFTQVKTVLQECRDSLIKPGSPEEQAALDKAKAVREAMAQKRKIQSERAAQAALQVPPVV